MCASWVGGPNQSKLFVCNKPKGPNPIKKRLLSKKSASGSESKTWLLLTPLRKVKLFGGFGGKPLDFPKSQSLKIRCPTAAKKKKDGSKLGREVGCALACFQRLSTSTRPFTAPQSTSSASAASLRGKTSQVPGAGRRQALLDATAGVQRREGGPTVASGREMLWMAAMNRTTQGNQG